MKIIARLRGDFPTKFGLPRQSGLVEDIVSKIVFEGDFRDVNALRGLEGFSHIWLIWEFSMAARDGWSPTVRPPRLGGNERVGVFATRSPFRPNPIGLSCVKLEKIEYSTPDGPVLWVRGADLMDGTPIFDIKPYLPIADLKPEATAGFARNTAGYALEVSVSDELIKRVPAEKQSALLGVLSQDPRPATQHDPDRVYGMEFAGFEVKFRVDGTRLTVDDIILKEEKP